MLFPLYSQWHFWSMWLRILHLVSKAIKSLGEFTLSLIRHYSKREYIRLSGKNAELWNQKPKSEYTKCSWDILPLLFRPTDLFHTKMAHLISSSLFLWCVSGDWLLHEIVSFIFLKQSFLVFAEDVPTAENKWLTDFPLFKLCPNVICIGSFFSLQYEIGFSRAGRQQQQQQQQQLHIQTWFNSSMFQTGKNYEKHQWCYKQLGNRIVVPTTSSTYVDCRFRMKMIIVQLGYSPCRRRRLLKLLLYAVRTVVCAETIGRLPLVTS